MDMIQAIDKIVKGNDLTQAEASEVMDLLLEGKATQAQMGGFLTALRMKGETLDEIVGCAKSMKSKALQVRPQINTDYVDMVGTGGDGTNTFNISTTGVFAAAGAGVKLCKHGNRAMSSKCGSVDVLEALGINVMLDDKGVEQCVDKCSVGFMFAQVFHKSMKNVGGPRKELKIRTIFNILGPLTCPANAKKVVIGVFDKNLVNPLANAFMQMGAERGVIVSGWDNMDEITTTGDTYISEINNGKITDYVVNPTQFGLPVANAQDLKGGTPEENAAIIRAILDGEKGAKRDIVLMNAGAAIYIDGIAKDLAEGIKMAAESIDSGRAKAKLDEMIAFTNSLK